MHHLSSFCFRPLHSSTPSFSTRSMFSKTSPHAARFASVYMRGALKKSWPSALASCQARQSEGGLNIRLSISSTFYFPCRIANSVPQLGRRYLWQHKCRTLQHACMLVKRDPKDLICCLSGNMQRGRACLKPALALPRLPGYRGATKGIILGRETSRGGWGGGG